MQPERQVSAYQPEAKITHEQSGQRDQKRLSLVGKDGAAKQGQRADRRDVRGMGKQSECRREDDDADENDCSPLVHLSPPLSTWSGGDWNRTTDP